jgi:spermidine/putrescine transport system ATP-binding protein
MTRAVAIELADLTRMFAGRAAVSHVDLEIYEGEFFSIIGPSGSGKTTTLRMIAGLEHGTSGRVFLRGRDVTIEPAYRRPVNTVFQQYGLFPHLNVFDNVAFGLRERHEARRAIATKVPQMLELVGLAGREKSRPRELSGGEQQRVALARSLVLSPQVLLLDEPVGALDLKLRKQMQRLFKQLQRDLEITFVYVTHDQEEAFSMSDRVAVMNNGRLEQVGVPYEVYSQPATFFVADFVGASNCIDGAIREAAPGGAYVVEQSGSRTSVDAKGVPGCGVGDPVVLLARPEAARIGENEGAALRARGRVSDVAYWGPQVSYTVHSQEAGSITVLAQPDSRSGLLGIGEDVNVWWASSDLWVIPRGATANKADQAEVSRQ